jgi:hypothetical protein
MSCTRRCVSVVTVMPIHTVTDPLTFRFGGDVKDPEQRIWSCARPNAVGVRALHISRCLHPLHFLAPLYSPRLPMLHRGLFTPLCAPPLVLSVASLDVLFLLWLDLHFLGNRRYLTVPVDFINSITPLTVLILGRHFSFSSSTHFRPPAVPSTKHVRPVAPSGSCFLSNHSTS